MKIDFLFSFLKLLAETKDQKTFFNHLFIIEDTYKVPLHHFNIFQLYRIIEL